MAKNIQFEVRVTQSGSNGVAFYIPAHIEKIANLKDKKNHKMQAVLDEDGDIIIYAGSLEDKNG